MVESGNLLFTHRKRRVIVFLLAISKEPSKLSLSEKGRKAGKNLNAKPFMKQGKS